MALTIPHLLIETLLRHVKSTYLPKRFANPKRAHVFTNEDVVFFAESVAALSAGFTSERASLPKNYLNQKEYRSGYILYFLISNYLKSVQCLNDLWRREKLPRRMEMLDIGTGPGTAIFATHDWCKAHNTAFSAIGVDQNRSILNDARAIANQYAPGAALSFLPGDIQRFPPSLSGKKFSLITLSNILNELPNTDKRAALIQLITSRYLQEEGYLIIIEPALQKVTRELMELRDIILERADPQSRSLRIMAPCLHQGSCPMLEHNQRDWCHAYIDWTRPDIIAKFDQAVGLRKDYLKYSYLIFKWSATLPPTLSQTTWRVVSSPLISNGKQELLLCNHESKLFRATRLNRDFSTSNATFGHVVRGDLVEYHGSERMDKEDEFKILTPHS